MPTSGSRPGGASHRPHCQSPHCVGFSDSCRFPTKSWPPSGQRGFTGYVYFGKPRECKRGRFHKPPHIAPFHHPKAYKENPHAHIAPKGAQPTCVKETYLCGKKILAVKKICSHWLPILAHCQVGSEVISPLMTQMKRKTTPLSLPLAYRSIFHKAATLVGRACLSRTQIGILLLLPCNRKSTTPLFH